LLFRSLGHSTAATPHATIPGASAPTPARRALAAHIGAAVDAGIVEETASSTAEAPASAASTMAPATVAPVATTMAATSVAPAATPVAPATSVAPATTTPPRSLRCCAGQNIGGHKSAGKIHHDHDCRRQEPRQQPSPWSTLHLLSSLLATTSPADFSGDGQQSRDPCFERKGRQPSVDGARWRARVRIGARASRHVSAPPGSNG
jgi:hypothetical protein